TDIYTLSLHAALPISRHVTGFDVDDRNIAGRPATAAAARRRRRHVGDRVAVGRRRQAAEEEAGHVQPASATREAVPVDAHVGRLSAAGSCSWAASAAGLPGG